MSITEQVHNEVIGNGNGTITGGSGSSSIEEAAAQTSQE